ncbi:hypothetical protein ZWY2020_025771 [Hordeum vulgare]|nr:hypothetical protein ZWY2020_025771 [Hordeum vulgare]
MQPAEMDSPVREMQEMDEFVLVPHAADLWSYQLDEDDDDHDARFLASNDEKTIDVNHFASEPTPHAAVQCGTKEPPAPSGSESEGSVDVEEEAVDGLLEKASDADEGGRWLLTRSQSARTGKATAVTGGSSTRSAWSAPWGWRRRPPAWPCFSAATSRRRTRSTFGGWPVPKVSARRDERLDQRMSVPRFEHAPAMISFGGSYGGHMF